MLARDAPPTLARPGYGAARCHLLCSATVVRDGHAHTSTCDATQQHGGEARRDAAAPPLASCIMRPLQALEVWASRIKRAADVRCKTATCGRGLLRRRRTSSHITLPLLASRIKPRTCDAAACTSAHSFVSLRGASSRPGGDVCSHKLYAGLRAVRTSLWQRARVGARRSAPLGSAGQLAGRWLAGLPAGPG